jgi:hypothetical protein
MRSAEEFFLILAASVFVARLTWHLADWVARALGLIEGTTTTTINVANNTRVVASADDEGDEIVSERAEA